MTNPVPAGIAARLRKSLELGVILPAGWLLNKSTRALSGHSPAKISRGGAYVSKTVRENSPITLCTTHADASSYSLPNS